MKIIDLLKHFKKQPMAILVILTCSVLRLFVKRTITEVWRKKRIGNCVKLFGLLLLLTTSPMDSFAVNSGPPDIATVKIPAAGSGTLYQKHHGSLCLTRENKQDKTRVSFEVDTTKDFRSVCNFAAESVLSVNSNWTIDINVHDRSGVGRTLYLQSKAQDGSAKRDLLIEWVKIKNGDHYDYEISFEGLNNGSSKQKILRGSGRMHIHVGKRQTKFTYGSDTMRVNQGFLGTKNSKRAVLTSWEANDPHILQLPGVNMISKPASATAPELDYGNCLEMGEAYPYYHVIAQHFVTQHPPQPRPAGRAFLGIGLGVRFLFPSDNDVLYFAEASAGVSSSDSEFAYEVLPNCIFGSESGVTSTLECSCKDEECQNNNMWYYPNTDDFEGFYNVFFYRPDHSPNCAVFRGVIPITQIYDYEFGEYPPPEWNPQPKPSEPEPGEPELYCAANPDSDQNIDLDWNSDGIPDFNCPLCAKYSIFPNSVSQRIFTQLTPPLSNECPSGLLVSQGDLSQESACRQACERLLMQQGVSDDPTLEDNCDTFIPYPSPGCHP